MTTAVIECTCSKCSITLADGKAKLKFQCGCEDCRQALQYGHSHGGIKPDPLPELFYMASDIIEVRGKESMKALQLRDEDPDIL